MPWRTLHTNIFLSPSCPHSLLWDWSSPSVAQPDTPQTRGGHWSWESAWRLPGAFQGPLPSHRGTISSLTKFYLRGESTGPGKETQASANSLQSFLSFLKGLSSNTKSISKFPSLCWCLQEVWEPLLLGTVVKSPPLSTPPCKLLSI